jgi:hypothetical protein
MEVADKRGLNGNETVEGGREGGGGVVREPNSEAGSQDDEELEGKNS